MTDKIVRIGGASGFWGDPARSARQLVGGALFESLVLYYLASVTLCFLAASA